MATIKYLPDEVIAIIFGYNDITIEDIINFRCVCKQFRWAVKNDKYWEKKFSQRWPSAKKLYDKQSKENEQKESKENEQKNKKSLYFMETGINCVKQLRNYVSQIIHKYYHDNDSINNLTRFGVMFYLDKHLRKNICDLIHKPENLLKYCFFTDEMKSLLTSMQSPPRTGCDLTEIYCNIKLFCYMRYCYSMDEWWNRYEKQPSTGHLLEQTATIVARCYQPEKDVCYSWVNASLDSIALEVLTCLREKHPDHSIFSTSAETFSYWKNNNIDDNYWNEAEGTQIMDILQEYIFGKLNFRPSKDWKDLVTLKHIICIDYVLRNKKGLDIILLIIYHSVARRLGLRCDVINLQYCCSTISTYCIFWKPKYAGNSPENIRCFNISDQEFPDCLCQDHQHNHQLLLLRTLYSNSGIPFVITAVQMLSEIIRTFNKAKFQFYNSLGFEPKNKFNSKNMLSLSVKKTEQLNTRPEDVKFAVGMIVTHVDQSKNSCAGVIIGWHRKIDRQVPFSTHSVWDIRKLPLNLCCNINFTKLQTNYIILTDNNKMCYVGEDAITLTTPKWIKNSEIGRYFCKFENTHYVPNKMLARLYPQDAAITAKTTMSENY